MLVLASRSPSRLETLQRAGLHPRVIAADVDEDAIVARYKDAPCDKQVYQLAKAKAQAVAASYEVTTSTIIIGCDSMFYLDGTLLGKPHTAEVARQRIRAMRGRTGTLYTGHYVIYYQEPDAKPQELGDVSAADVHFGQMSDAEIDAYISTGEPLEVAGSFTLEGYGGAFIDGIEGDHHGVIGLSLPLLRNMLKQFGIFWPDLWERGDND